MIKVTDIAHVRLRAPDLDLMEKFLVDFGLVRSARTDTALYMRATDADHHVHVTELGEPAFLGMAFNAASESDLSLLAAFEGASAVEEIDEPGGGKRVRLTDPDGFEVEIVHGIEELQPLAVKNVFTPNSGAERHRLGEFVRLEGGPAQCKRLGHVVINVTDFKATDIFYKSHFGFLNSDELYGDDNPDETIIAFNRVNRGREYVDHHALLTVPMADSGLGHIAFEVEDVNAIHLGHEHLTAAGHRPSWGIGRHILGAQIFDYWFDPYGFRVEHWADGDLLNVDSPTGRHPASRALDVQWGAGPETRVV